MDVDQADRVHEIRGSTLYFSCTTPVADNLFGMLTTRAANRKDVGRVTGLRQMTNILSGPSLNFEYLKSAESLPKDRLCKID